MGLAIGGAHISSEGGSRGPPDLEGRFILSSKPPGAINLTVQVPVNASKTAMSVDTPTRACRRARRDGSVTGS